MTTYIKISTLEYPRHIGDIELDPAGMQDYAQVENTDMPEHIWKKQHCLEGQPVQKNGVWYKTWVVQDAPIPPKPEGDQWVFDEEEHQWVDGATIGVNTNMEVTRV
jgi:hypothetical protein